MQTESRTWLWGLARGRGGQCVMGHSFSGRQMVALAAQQVNALSTAQPRRDFLSELHATVNQCFKSARRESGCSKRNKLVNSM